MEDETYCIGIACVMLLSMLGLLIISVVGPLIQKKINDFKLRKPVLAAPVPALKAELSLIEISGASTHYKLLCPVYIAEEDINQWSSEESVDKTILIPTVFVEGESKNLKSFSSTDVESSSSTSVIDSSSTTSTSEEEETKTLKKPLISNIQTRKWVMSEPK